MLVKNNSVSFQSNIKLITPCEFKSMTANLNSKRHKVGWPWTADTMKTGKNLFTTGILDCIAGGIVDGSDITMFHLGIYNQAKAKIYHQKGFKIGNFKRRILEKIDLKNENLHAFIVGGIQMKPEDKYNVKTLNKITKFFDKYKIPYSIFASRKDVHYFGRYSLLYSNKEDTLYITNTLIDSPSLNNKNIEIDIKDNVIEYNVYKKGVNKHGGVTYDCIREATGTEDFLRSQFRKVSVCKFDNILNK